MDSIVMTLQIPVIFNVFFQGAQQAVSRYILIFWNLRFAAECHLWLVLLFFFIFRTLPPFIRDVQCAALLVHIVSSYASLNWKSEGHRFGLTFVSAFSFSCRLCSIFVFLFLRSILFFLRINCIGVMCVHFIWCAFKQARWRSFGHFHSNSFCRIIWIHGSLICLCISIEFGRVWSVIRYRRCLWKYSKWEFHHCNYFSMISNRNIQYKYSVGISYRSIPKETLDGG